MPDANKDFKTITEAIDYLEKTGSKTAHHLNETFGKDFEDVKKALENLKPYLENLKEKVESETKKTKNEVEVKIKENPWLALGIIGVIGIFIGWILGRDRK